jgi:hypothetical protein
LHDREPEEERTAGDDRIVQSRPICGYGGEGEEERKDDQAESGEREQGPA